MTIGDLLTPDDEKELAELRAQKIAQRAAEAARAAEEAAAKAAEVKLLTHTKEESKVIVGTMIDQEKDGSFIVINDNCTFARVSRKRLTVRVPEKAGDLAVLGTGLRELFVEAGKTAVLQRLGLRSSDIAAFALLRALQSLDGKSGLTEKSYEVLKPLAKRVAKKQK